uniref:beta-N-acetylhexosaminidase n=2 Tax=Paenibacillus athensensis TaxID=1967502 RepID=A0A4Y8PXD3_9BACL
MLHYACENELTRKGRCPMKKSLWTAGAICAVLLATACTRGSDASPAPSAAGTPQAVATASPAASPTPTPTPTPDPVQARIDAMSVEEKIGQMVLAGIDGTAVGAPTRELLQTYHVGGIILYKNNIENAAQLAKLVNALKETNAANPAPLWIGVDEEGGRVTRLPAEVDKAPAAAKIGATGSTALAKGIGSWLGEALAGFGLNVDFAPVLDVNSNPANPVIGDRSFGAKADLVAKLGVPEMQGIAAQRVLPVVKHFPGHGDTSVDSHVGLPVVPHDLTRLRSLELAPFKAVIGQGADAVMVAHLLLPKLDADHPASFSKPVITGLLREELGFRGVVMTDDMTMGAIAENYNLQQAVVQSVLAGADVLLVGHGSDNVAAVVSALRAAVQEQRIPLATIDASVRRIVLLKDKYRAADSPVEPPQLAPLNAKLEALLQRYLPAK